MKQEQINLIQRWENASERLRQAKSELNSAECEISNSTNALGKSLCPKDSQAGEKYSIWIDNKLLEVEVISWAGNDYKVRWRE